MSEKRMSTVVLTWRGAFSCPASPFTSTEKHIAHQLAQYMSPQGDSCYPAVDTLAANSGHANSTVRDALNRLTEWGFLGREARRGRGHSNQYIALIPDYFDRFESAHENRRRAALFAEGADWTPASLVVVPDSAAPDRPGSDTAGERRFSEGDAEDVNRRGAAEKPPVESPKTAGERRRIGPGPSNEFVQTRSSSGEELLVSADADERERLVEALKWALTVELRCKPVTRSEHGAWGLAIAELVDAGATIEDVQIRCAAYRDKWPEMALTPMALTRHWSLLGARVELETPGSTIDAWVEKTGWMLDEAAARDVLEDWARTHEVSVDDVERHLARCRQILAERQAANATVDQALEEARRVA